MGKIRKLSKETLFDLDLTSHDFDQYLELIGISRMAEKLSGKFSPYRFRHISHGRGGWWSSRENFKLSDAQIASHLTGRETFGVRAPKWGSKVGWVDFDIDHADGNFYDERITKLIEIFGKENLLLQYRKASGNFSLLGRCLPLWENIHQAEFREILELSGLKVEKGNIEIFPDVGRGRRLPLGDQQVFPCVDFDKAEGVWQEYIGKAKQIEAFASLEPIRPLAILKDLRLTLKSQKSDTSKPWESLAHLKESPKFSTDGMWRGGLSAPGTRYDTERKLILYCYVNGKSENITYQLIRKWYTEGKTNGFSDEWKTDQAGTLKLLKAHVRSFYAWLKGKLQNGGNKGHTEQAESESLSLEDVRRVFDICKGLPTSGKGLHCAEFMFDLLSWCKARDDFSELLWLSAAKLRGKTTADGERLKGFRNGRDCRSKWLPFLEEQGILSCVNHRYEKGVYCRGWGLDWEFADGQSAEGLTYREALTKVTDVDEIKDYFKRMTAWRINQLRGKLAAIEEKAETVTLDPDTLNPDTSRINEMFGLNQMSNSNLGGNAHQKRNSKFRDPKAIGGWNPLRC